MSLFPHLNPLGLGEIGALVAAGMTPVTHGADPEVVTFLATALFISELIRVSGYYGSILDPADLAGRLPNGL